jgi:hypothetical protein
VLFWCGKSVSVCVDDLVFLCVLRAFVLHPLLLWLWLWLWPCLLIDCRYHGKRDTGHGHSIPNRYRACWNGGGVVPVHCGGESREDRVLRCATVWLYLSHSSFVLLFSFDLMFVVTPIFALHLVTPYLPFQLPFLLPCPTS